ncbi:MAG: GAF domain-containing protein, partial [Candidatus Omnitrophica bacterium]|nr:GAF domain-containing protein [Candidatus Omnitrophota bacterium]
IYFIPQLKDKTEKAIEKVLFKNRYLYRTALQKFGNRITFDLSQEKLLDNTVNFISKVMRVSYVSIMLKNEIYGQYSHGASVGFDDDEIKGLEFAEDSELVNWLSENKTVLIKDEMEKILPLEKIRLLSEDMDRAKACLCIPLHASVDVIGFLCLSERAANEIYSHIDIGLLQSIAGQVSLVIAYKRLEEHMLQSEKLASLGTLAAGLAHEIKNPLSSIQIFAQLFPQKYNDEEFRNKFNRVVVRDVLRISKLIDNVLSLTKSKPAELAPHNINDIVDDVLSLLDSELLKNKVKVVKSYSKLPLANCNDEELKQVFLNIIINAMHAMPDGGTLRISSSTVPIATSRDIERRRAFARVKIQDSGCGIEEKVLNKLFDPFFTTRAEGTGLGLALVHRIIKQHNGFIGVESKLGEGTVFWIDLPVV